MGRLIDHGSGAFVKVLLADNDAARAELVASALSGTAQVARIGSWESLLDAVRRPGANQVLVDMGRYKRDIH